MSQGAGRPGTHAVVVGMHRSGTSAVANAVVRLGLTLPDVSDLITPGPFNERGYWESRRFVTYSDTILRHLGGTWSAPPLPEQDWALADDRWTSELRTGAAKFVREEFRGPHLVLKDPRLCITLPLWRTALPERPVAILVLRDPLEVARSLGHRNDFPLTLGLALWRRYVQQSIAAVEGLPVFVLEYGELISESQRGLSDLALFLAEQGIELAGHNLPEAVAALEPALRHHSTAGSDTAPRTSDVLVEEQRSFAQSILSRRGPNPQWSTFAALAEPQWVNDVITLERSGEMVTFGIARAESELKWIKRSRLFAATRAIWRATSSGPTLSELPAPTGNGSAAPENQRDRLLRWPSAPRRVLNRRPAAVGPQIRNMEDPVSPETLPGFRFCAVIKTWMDEDLIEATVRNVFAHGADAVYLVDNASSDATLANATRAGATVAEVYETEVFDGRLVQSLVNAVVARESLRSGADHVWWLLLDSDEFPEGPAGQTVREYLAGLDRRFRVVGATFMNHVPSGSPEYLEGFHPIDFQPLCYVFEPANNPPCPLGHWKHPLQRFDRHGQFVLSNDGAHLAFSSDPLVEPREGIVMHHFQYRDEQFTRAKLELICGPRANRIGLHESAGFSGFARRRRSLDAVYTQQWDALDVLPNRRVSAHRNPRPWSDLAGVKRWYERKDAEQARDEYLRNEEKGGTSPTDRREGSAL